MCPTTSRPNDILHDDNYFLWEFNARMTLARKDLLDHVMLKPEHAMLQDTVQWKAADLKALAVIAKLLGPAYQSMIREASSAVEAWEILRSFFVKQNLHNRVQLRKQLHEFEMSAGDNLMEHLLRFDDLCLRLSAVGDTLSGDERLVILLGSLPSECDSMVRTIEARGNVDLLEAMEMLRREYENMQKGEKKESAFKAAASGARMRPTPRQNNNKGRFNNGRGANQYQNERDHGAAFNGQCFECKQYGHKREFCPQRKKEDRKSEFVFSATSETTPAWLLDSGASSHMSHDRGDFCELRELSSTLEISVANGHRLPARGVGAIRFALADGKTVRLTDVLYVPGLNRKLLSVPALTANGVSAVFESDVCSFVINGETVARVRKAGKLYEWTPEAPALQDQSIEVAAASFPDEAFDLWHARLGHIPATRMAATSHVTSGIPPVCEYPAISRPCEGCACGKLLVARFSRRVTSQVKSCGILDLIHSDVMGPVGPKSRGGARYVLTFIDDFSRFVWIYLLKTKSEVPARFAEFVQLVLTQTGARVKCIRADNSGEYTSKQFNSYCAKYGIVHQASAPYTPQQNGLAERMYRTIAEMARSMLYYQQLDKCWWGEAIQTATYLVNRLPNAVRSDVTPFELVTKSKLLLDQLRVFDSRGFVHVDKSKRTKWDKKAHRCIFLGYADGSKAYRIWDIDADKPVVSRTVQLDERSPSAFRDVAVMPEIENYPTFADGYESDVPPLVPQPTSTADMKIDSELIDTSDVDMETDSREPALQDVHPQQLARVPTTARASALPHASEGGDQQQMVVARSNQRGRQAPHHNLELQPSARDLLRNDALMGENRLVFSGSSQLGLPAYHPEQRLLLNSAAPIENQLVALPPRLPPNVG